MSIPKRDLLATLSKPELLEIERRFELEVTGKMTKDDLLDRLAPAELGRSRERTRRCSPKGTHLGDRSEGSLPSTCLTELEAMSRDNGAA